MSSDNFASFYFHQGTNFESYFYLGCNRYQKGYVFRVWAPNADSVLLVGDFTGWDSPLGLSNNSSDGVWELYYETDESLEKQAYKFIIEKNGKRFYKGDPYARFSRGKDDGASLVFTSLDYKWGDAAWLKNRKSILGGRRKNYLGVPVNIYELHLGSFMRNEDGSYLSYRALSDILVPYLKYMGYTHVELLPVMEHPYDGSWGYQVCAFYAPTSRFGDPDDFRFLIDSLHRAGIGVILDWVPAHFPKDAWGLFEFDGTPLYEYQGSDRMESASWGTRFFDLGREEIQSFLISNALYYLKEFHVDGLRVDAVASMIYLDYDKAPGEWVPNTDGTNENKEGTSFIKKLNKEVFARFPDVLMIAEESAAFGGITRPVHEGGLGFNLKWNMGFANDFYDYVSLDPVFRKYHHKALNFPLMYAFSENYCLPISHDEVVHGKKSFIDKMFGSYEDKFAEARAALLLIMTYPGKKMLFMGTEFAQFREWDFENSLEWFMLDYPKHRAFREYVRALNSFYLSRRELWSYDFSGEGFEWIYPDEAEKNTVAYKRKAGRDELTVIVNLSGSEQYLKIPIKQKSVGLEVLFESSSGASQALSVFSDNGQKYTEIKIDAFSAAIFNEISLTKNYKIKENGYVL
ncbi:MAG: 1,4-alpha-glucan branching protein GlgB [Clostridia bacterium]|nr:1,4-alpha-glucan branching protein GlgB [Clostridia bacterium]